MNDNEYETMEIKNGINSVGFWEGYFDRNKFFNEFGCCVSTVVVFFPKSGKIEIHQVGPCILPEKIAGVKFSGIFKKRVSSEEQSFKQGREVFDEVFQLKNTMILSSAPA